MTPDVPNRTAVRTDFALGNVVQRRLFASSSDIAGCTVRRLTANDQLFLRSARSGGVGPIRREEDLIDAGRPYPYGRQDRLCTRQCRSTTSFRQQQRHCRVQSRTHGGSFRAEQTPGESGVLGLGDVVQAEDLDGVLAHLDLADLAGDGHRELVDDVHVARDLVVRELAAAELAQLPRRSADAPSLQRAPRPSVPRRTARPGTPITCASTMSGWVYRNSSISRGYTFSPPRITMSLIRPTMLT